MNLCDIAPRLGLARDQVLAERAAADHRRMSIIRRRHELEKLVAHRELQLVRAASTGKGRYISLRQRKLDSARHALEQVELESRAAA